MSVLNKFNVVLMLFLVFLTFSCSIKPDGSIGKYVFYDDEGVIHIDESCRQLRSGKDSNGHSTYAMACVDTTDFVFIDRVCSQCVNTSGYEHLTTIYKRNKARDESRLWLFEKSKILYYDFEDYDSFVSALESQSLRRIIYTKAQSKGLNVGSTFEEFNNILGYELPAESNPKRAESDPDYLTHIIWGVSSVLLAFLIIWIYYSLKALKDPDVQAASKLGMSITRFRKYERLYEEYWGVKMKYGLCSPEADAFFRTKVIPDIDNLKEWHKYEDYRAMSCWEDPKETSSEVNCQPPEPKTTENISVAKPLKESFWKKHKVLTYATILSGIGFVIMALPGAVSVICGFPMLFASLGLAMGIILCIKGSIAKRIFGDENYRTSSPNLATVLFILTAFKVIVTIIEAITYRELGYEWIIDRSYLMGRYVGILLASLLWSIVIFFAVIIKNYFTNKSKHKKHVE